MELEEIKRLPFVVEAYKLIFPQNSRCGICGLPWPVCKPKTIQLSEGEGVFALCEHCWSKATLLEVMKAHADTFVEQYYSLDKKSQERFIKETPLEYVLQCVEKEYISTNKEK